MGDEEPPRKKRRSKWDITPSAEPSSIAPTAGATVSSQPAPAPSAIEPASNVPSSAIAAAAAAKINAMLASQGKLAKSDPPLAKPTPPTPTLLPPLPASHSTLAPSAGGLLKPAGLLAPPTTPPLFTPGGGPHYVQDKVFVGLEQAPESFKVVEKLQGPGGSFLQHIATQTGAKVFLRGRGSGYIEPTSGKESFEALHVYISHPNKSGLGSARKLSESLIETVKTEYETFKTSQQKSAPLGFGSSSGYTPPPPAHGYVNPYQTSFPPPAPGGAAPPPPRYPPAPGYAPPYQGQPPPPPGPNYGYYPPPGGGGEPPPTDVYGAPLPPPPHPGAFYPPPGPPPYATGGAEFGGGAPPPHPGHFHPPSHLPPAGSMESHDQHTFYRPHNRSPEPPPKRKFTEQVEKPADAPEDDTHSEHLSISNAGSSTSSSNASSQEKSSGNGWTTTQDAAAPPSRKFSEGLPPVVSASTNEPMGGVSGSGPPPPPAPAKDDNSGGVASGEGAAPVNEGLTTMKPPSFPPPSKFKEPSAMLPPPSLPSRFAKASPSSTKTAATPNATETADATADSAKKAPTPSTGNHDNDDSVGSPKPTKVLSALVAYGDDSDSDIDT